MSVMEEQNQALVPLMFDLFSLEKTSKFAFWAKFKGSYDHVG